MKKYVLICMGGFIGAILRYLIKAVHIYNYHEKMPLNTLIINVTGCFVLAFIISVCEESELDTDIRIGIITGLIGAYTTFSTLCKETAVLILQGDYYSAVTYVTISTVLGIIAAYFGTVFTREVISHLLPKENKEEAAENVAQEVEGEVD